jgi:hypothetical protein
MFKQILYTQVRWTRTLVLGLGLLNLLLPVAAWNLSFGGAISGLATPYVRGFEQLGPLAIFFACIAGFALAAMPWNVDAQAKHVYPLALPITWPRYVSYRFAAGALLVGVTGLALLAGLLLVLSMIDLPPIIHAYPGTFFLRYLTAALLAYALSFALQYLGGRRAAAILIGILLTVLIVPTALDLAGLGAVNDAMGRMLFEWPGPFAVFTEPWRLVDV